MKATGVLCGSPQPGVLRESPSVLLERVACLVGSPNKRAVVTGI